MRDIDLYRRGLVIEYPTDAAAPAGSCIFIHVWRAAGQVTTGCVALPEPRVVAVQDFAEHGAVIAIVPRGMLDRFFGMPTRIADRLEHDEGPDQADRPRGAIDIVKSGGSTSLLAPLMQLKLTLNAVATGDRRNSGLI